MLLLTHNIINEKADDIRNRRVEGTHLVQLTPDDEGLNLHKKFTRYVMMYAKHYNITPSMAPFAKRTHGREWFTRKFPAPSKDQEAESLAIWEVFLTSKLITTRLRPLKNQIIILSYQPNLVSRPNHVQTNF